MSARKVDIVFVLDTSESIDPMFDAVRRSIGELVEPLKQASFDWRIDFVAASVPNVDVERVMSVNAATIRMLYWPDSPHEFLRQAAGEGRFEELPFTRDLELFKQRLGELKAEGDEDMLFALDCALDFPFRSMTDTQRVVILISDEPFTTNEPGFFKEHKEKVDALIKKIMDRHVTYIAIMPNDDEGIAERLSMADKAELVEVEKGDTGLTQVDFRKLFAGFGKTISVGVASGSDNENYERALMGQYKFLPSTRQLTGTINDYH